MTSKFTRSLPVVDADSSTTELDRLIVKVPWPMKWSEMDGNDQVRFCRHCAKSVYNFFEMTREEIEVVRRANPERLCGILINDADGKLLTKDSDLPPKKSFRFRFSILALILLMTALSPVMAVSPALYRWAKSKWSEWNAPKQITTIAPQDMPLGGVIILPDMPESPSP